MPVAELGLSRRTSVVNGSSSSLTRRRSLAQTPGVATRTSPVDRRKTWNSWKAPKIAPEEEAKWALSSSGITSINRVSAVIEDSQGSPAPRAQTPGEMDYAHLGSFSVGTLGIVNGAPSPAASAKMTSVKARITEDDYFSVAEADSSPLTMKTSLRRDHSRSQSSVLPATTPLQNNIPMPQREPPAPPALDDGQPGSQLDPPNSPILPAYARNSIEISVATDRDVAWRRHDSNTYAQQYQAYIPYSPFANTTFDREEDHVRPTEAVDFREESNRILTRTMFGVPTTASETSGSSLFAATSPVSVPEHRMAKQSRRPAPRTSDSGYSSGGSFRRGSRSLQSAASATSSKSSRDGMCREQSVSPGYPHHIVTHVGPVEMTAEQATEATQWPTSLQMPSRSALSDELLSPRSPSSVDSLRSAQRRLQKHRTSQAELPVVQTCQPSSEPVIPDIPSNVRDSFTRRISLTPGMECLIHTYPSKNHVTTIESMVQPATDVPNEPVVPLTELEPERSPTPPAHGQRRSLSLFRRKSTVGSVQPDKEDNASAGIVDLGSIASSIGGSPYDAAMSGRQRKSVTSPTYPHQLGAALPRAKSMVNMDAEAATEFARMRSKDRAQNEPEKPQHQRRKSYHNSKTEIGEVKASKRRPQSALHEIPPVPTINASLLQVPHSARPRLESEVEQKTNLSFGTHSCTQSQVVSKSGGEHRYTQADASQKEVDWSAYSRHWRQRRKSVGEGLRTHAGFSEASASAVTSRNLPPPSPHRDMTAWDRYSGGLEYNYEGRGKISGSAGTRQLHSAASSKSLKWRNQYGVDLSDVPIMLQRA